jgi:cell division ATPase FtsA
MTINEIRAKHSLDKIDGGDVILNQAYITALGMSQQQAQEQGQGQQDEEEQSEDYGQEEGQEKGGETQDQEKPSQEDNEGEEVNKSLSSYKFSIEI